MDKALLVNIDVEAGVKILSILDDAGVRINVASWVHFSEYGDWRFVLSSPRLDAAGPLNAYSVVHAALDGARFRVENTPPLMIMRMSDPFVRELRRTFRKTKSVEGMRLGGQTIGNRFVEDAYVYRIS